MVTPRVIRDDITNLLDYLLIAQIAAYTSVVSVSGSASGGHVTWHPYRPDLPFLVNRGDPSLDDYRSWVEAGAFSALLLDGALLQITYEISGGAVSGHRLAYIPCPYRLDPVMVRQDPILDLIDLYIEAEPTRMVLHSPIRFDFDPASADRWHPSAHLTINSPNCRIACTAPMHVRRFADFIFRHFYPEIWRAHTVFFAEGARREIGTRIIAEEDLGAPHIAWQVR